MRFLYKSYSNIFPAKKKAESFVIFTNNIVFWHKQNKEFLSRRARSHQRHLLIARMRILAEHFLFHRKQFPIK